MQKEEDNEFNTTAVALSRDACLKENVVGHVPVLLRRTFYSLLKLPGCIMSATGTSKRVNRGACDGLEIPVVYRFFGDKRAVTWVKMQVEKIVKNVNYKVNRCMK